MFVLFFAAWKQIVFKFKVPEDWKPLEMKVFEVGLDLDPVKYPEEDYYFDLPSVQRITKGEMTVASSSTTLPNPKFPASLKEKNTRFILERHFYIKPKYGYWARLPTPNCDPTTQFVDVNGTPTPRSPSSI